MKNIILSGFAVFLLSSCAHHRDVRPGVEGLHSVSVRSETKDNGARSCLRQAEHFCDKRGRYLAIVKEEAMYTGSMSEADYNRAKTAAKVTKGIGSAAFVFGGKKEKQLGGIAALGGNIADGAIGKGYTVKMSFRCK